MRALAWEQQRDRRVETIPDAGELRGSAQRGDGVGVRARDDGPAMLESLAAGLQRERDIGEGIFFQTQRHRGLRGTQRDTRLFFILCVLCVSVFKSSLEKRREIVRLFFQSRRSFCGEHDHLRAVARARRRKRRSLFENHVRVGSADAERTHARTSRHVAARPVAQFCVDEKRRLLELQRGVDLLAIDAGGNFFVMKRERGFDEARDARRGVAVADVSLHRAERAELLRVGRLAENLRESRDLDRVAERGRGAVRLDVGNRLR